jgi:hypothetical protein
VDVLLLKVGETKEHQNHVTNNATGHQKLVNCLQAHVEDLCQVRAVMKATNIY